MRNISVIFLEFALMVQEDILFKYISYLEKLLKEKFMDDRQMRANQNNSP